MDAERALVTALSRGQSMRAVLERRIEPHHFVERVEGDSSPVPMPCEVFAWQLEHQRRYRAVPSLDLARARFPLFEFMDATDTADALADQVVRSFKRRRGIEALRGLAKDVDDPERLDDLESHFFEAASAMARDMPGSRATRFSDSLNLLDLYEERERTGDAPGVSFCVPELDALTYGGQSHEMVVIEGFLGVKKSSLAIAMAAKAYFERGQSPLFFSLEMEGDKLVQKWAAMAAGIEYGAIKRMGLQPADKERWRDIAERAHDARFEKDIIVIDSERRITADKIYTEVERWRPDFWVVDTLDEVQAPNWIKSHWERADHVAREIKGICRATRRMGLVIAQAGREAAHEGAKIHNVASSITIARKADVAVGLHADEQMKKMHRIRFELLKNRDDGGEGTTIYKYFNPSNMELREWRPEDMVVTKA